MKLHKCHICQIFKFTPYHITEINKDKSVITFDLCKKCAEIYMQENESKKSSESNKIEIITAEELFDFISDLGKSSKKPEKRCSCGMSESLFNTEGRFGCAKCYDLFDDKMEKLVYPYHHADQHIGKIPKHLKKNDVNEKEKVLKLNYASAIELENYEKAGLIKKELDLLKQTQSTFLDQ